MWDMHSNRAEGNTNGMKIELLTYSADQLEALSDSELEKILSPFFNVTRPEKASKIHVSTSKPSTNKSYKQQDIALLNAIAVAKSVGVDMSKLIQKKGKQ
jgi:hypothetical protein